MAACQVLDLSPACLNLEGVRAGDRNETTIALKSDGLPVDLTGSTVTAQARETATDDDTALVATITMVDEANGTFIIAWPGADVFTLLAGQESWAGVYDVQVESAAGVTTVLSGTIGCVTDVTR